MIIWDDKDGECFFVLLGGIRSIGKTAAVMVPIMALLYIVGCLVIIARFANEVPAATRSRTPRSAARNDPEFCCASVSSDSSIGIPACNSIASS